jgi:N-acetylated-alpha-linked acidic dipeptidase
VPFVEFAALDNAVHHLTESAKAYDSALVSHGATLTPPKLAQLQALMLSADQTLAPDVGLPSRPWYKNLVYAPGRFTGYGVKTLPGIREAIEERRWTDANRYSQLTADALDAYARRLDQASATLTP